MTSPLDLPAGSVVGMAADVAPRAAVARPPIPGLIDSPTSAFAVPTPGPPGQDGADLSPEDLLELTEVVGENVEENLTPPINLVLLFENALQ